MTMYVPQRFAAPDSEAALTVIENHGFAALVTPAGDECHITHLPLLLDREKNQLLGHVARANRHHEYLERNTSTAIFTGPHAYFSPNWYLTATVPTWNYAVVHVQAVAALITDPDELYVLVERLSQQYESSLSNPWRPARGPGVDKQLRAIVGFSLPLESVTAKFKLDQHLGADAVEHLVANLESDAGKDHRVLAVLMRRQAK